ncbi:MAG: helix-turn-helix domain-containing protein [Treponema sp.]|nr:helix-turn-helix domain-containing protein [Treponema sp.]
MYKVMFVDDEPWVIIDILHSIPWKELGFEITGHYEKAMEARDAVIRLSPDLVFVDIQMPVMNGFEFITNCQEAGSQAAFVILSAYSDFELTRKAIQASVLDYCLKPVNPAVLIKTLGEIRERLDQADTAKQVIKQVYVPQNEQRFHKMLEFINGNFRGKISLRTLSEKFYFNEHYICYLFKKFTGTTFANYLTGLKIDEAKKILNTTHLPLRVIADELRFNDSAYFSRTFKRICGITPSEYRKKTSKHENSND